MPSQTCRSISELPGPKQEDHVAYNSRNHHYLTSLHEKYGDMFAAPVNGRSVVFVRRQDLVTRVLNNPEEFNKTWASEEGSSDTADYVMNLIQPLLRRTVFNIHGDHKENLRRRQAIRPCVLGAEDFAPEVEETIRQDLKTWPEGKCDIQDLSHNILRKCMLTILCGEFGQHMHGCLSAFHEVMDYFVKRYAPFDHEQTITEEDDKMMTKLFNAASVVVKDFRRRLEDCENPSKVMKRSLLYTMVKGEFTDEEMASTLVNVMIAAGEAPASGLAQTLEELGRNQTVQANIRDEFQRVVGNGKCAPKVEDLTYTFACIQEGMRLFAPATLVQRQAMQDCVLDDVFIPEGTLIGICVHSVHRNETVWENGSTFNPLRKNLDYEISEGFLSFSKGPRGCPGKHVAMAVCKIALGMVVSNFKLAALPAQPASSECEKVPKMVEWSVKGIPVILQRNLVSKM